MFLSILGGNEQMKIVYEVEIKLLVYDKVNDDDSYYYHREYFNDETSAKVFAAICNVVPDRVAKLFFNIDEYTNVYIECKGSVKINDSDKELKELISKLISKEVK